MKNKTTIIVILSLLILNSLSVFAHSKDKDWFNKLSQIKTGLSTKQEVESLFDSMTINRTNRFAWSESIYYRIKEGTVKVNYSLGNCSEGSDEYDFKKGIVTSFSIFSSKPIKTFKLKLDLRGFERNKEEDTSNWIYTNPELGVRYTLYKDRDLTEVAIGLAQTQIREHSCLNIQD